MPLKIYPKQKEACVINNKKVEIADTPFFPLMAKKHTGLWYNDAEEKIGQLDVFTQSPYAYYAIMTNNQTAAATNDYVSEFYIQRDDSERNF